MNMFRLLSGILLFSIFLLPADISAKQIVIGKNYVILCRNNATVMEQYAAETLQKYIKKSTGMKLNITSKNSSPAIKIVADRNLEREEHLIKALPNGDILVSGGLPSGVIYAAFEFLENVMNCRFLAVDAEYIPRMKRVTLAKDLLLRGKPAFLRRQLSNGPGVWHAQMDYFTKLRYSGVWIKGAYVDPYRWASGAGHGHSFYKLTRNFPKNKPEYFSLDTYGDRLRAVNGAGPGQLCLTHPEVRNLLTKNLISLITRTEKAFRNQPADKRQVFPYLYHVAKNDNQQDCVCPECLRAVKKYNGNHAGLMMDFVSDVARRTGKVHKDVLFGFLAYTTDEFPVKGYKLPENVMVIIAQLGSEFRTETMRDSMRSLHHPMNRRAKSLIREWRKSTSHLGMWDYWVLFRQVYAAPLTNVSTLADNIRFYKEVNVEKIYAQAEISFSTLMSFVDLRLYIASKMMLDPSRNVRALIDEFMRLYYGKAAPAMTAYLNYLEKRMQEDKNRFGLTPPVSRSYLDKDFYVQVEKYLADAEKAVAGSPVYLRRIGQERILVDQWVLHEYKKLGITVDVKKLAARLLKNHRICSAKYTDKKNAANWNKSAEILIKTCVDAPPLPKKFTDRKYFDFWGPKFKQHGTHDKKIKDPDSPTGTARRLGPVTPDFHNNTLELAVYDWTRKKHLLRKFIAKENYPQDEKYHWYKIGRTRLTARTQMIFHRSWSLSQACGNYVFDPLEPNAEYELYVSLKLTGPAYVKNSQKQNAVYLDRIVFLECTAAQGK